MFHVRTPVHMHRFLFILFVSGALLSSFAAIADKPRHNIAFVSENGRYVLLNIYRSIERVPIFENGQYVGVMDTKREEPVWGLFDAQTAKVLEPSNEVETLMAGSVPLYVLRGDFGPKTALVSDDGMNIVVLDDFSRALPAAGLAVLQFYRSGKLTAEYRLGELLSNVEHVGLTSSHFFWFSWDSLNFDGKTLSMMTTECVPLAFSVRTGAMIDNSREVPADRRGPRVDCEGMHD